MIRKWLRNGVLALACLATGVGSMIPNAVARDAMPPAAVGPDSTLPAAEVESSDSAAVISVSVMPRAARRTLALIQSGGPFPYAKDGAVFGNFERLLRRRARGYYREYTVSDGRPEGSALGGRPRGRGAKRIVCGGPVKQTNECYYSNDHYASFKLIVG